MAHHLAGPARLALLTVKVGVLVAIVVTGIVGRPDAAPGPGPDFSGFSGAPVADRPDRTARLLDAHDCSESGFDDGQQPLSAVVRSAHGQLRYVDFDTGWAVYTRHGQATLVAVCLDDPPRA